MNIKNCVRCNQSNPPEMRFCQNCGADLTTANELPPTVFGGNFKSGQTPPNFQSGQTPNFQPPNFQPPNFQPQQPVNFQQANYQTAPTSGGQTKKMLLGIGGVLFGLLMLISGVLKLFRASGGSSSINLVTVIIAVLIIGFVLLFFVGIVFFISKRGKN